MEEALARHKAQVRAVLVLEVEEQVLVLAMAHQELLTPEAVVAVQRTPVVATHLLLLAVQAAAA